MVVEVDPVANSPAGVLQALETLAMHPLLLECPDDTLDQAVLPWAVRGNELLPQSVAAYQARVVA